MGGLLKSVNFFLIRTVYVFFAIWFRDMYYIKTGVFEAVSIEMN